MTAPEDRLTRWLLGLVLLSLVAMAGEWKRVAW